MKNKKMVVLLLVGLLGLGGVIVSACAAKGSHKEDSTISDYTCPMHPQIHKDHPGDCPICGMALVPVQKETSPRAPHAPLLNNSGEGSPKAGVRISPDRQQLIGLKTSTAEKRPVAKEIRTVGRVAFDPELAVAQREFLGIARNVPSLRESAISRLRLLGMGEDEIRELEHVGARSSRTGREYPAPTSLYLPEIGDSVWVYATIFQDEMAVVKPGMEATISLPSGSDQSFTGTVRAVDPVVNPTTRSGRARIEIPIGGGRLRPDSYVNVSLKVDLGEAITVPRSAVIDTGARKVAFIVTDGEHFQSRNIKTGPDVGNDVVVQEGIQAGEKVVSSATFLVDSESQLKMAVAGMEEHKH